ncbi:MAG: hypothetical protein IAE97_03725 [Chthoniobacterales bacterium]|nr:hypothetical protein [Chthoniobacterales bacterium]
MKRAAVFLFVAFAGVFTAGADLTARQMKGAEHVAPVSIPTPAEFFAAIDKAGKPDWASLYREPGPTSYPTRTQTALNLGALVTDGYMAVEAQDGQQVKNTGKEIIALAKALGVGEDVLVRGKSIGDFADKNDWFALREELDATTNEVRRAMAGQRDAALASLITAGAWLRAIQVGSRAALLNGEEQSLMLLRQPALIAMLREDLRQLPDKARGGPVITRTDMTLTAVEDMMTPPDGEPFGTERVVSIRDTTSQLVSDMSSNKP